MPQTPTEILRDHTGKLHLYVDGRPVVGAIITGFDQVNGAGLCASVFVPLQHASLGEVRNVVPLVRSPPL